MILHYHEIEFRELPIKSIKRTLKIAVCLTIFASLSCAVFFYQMRYVRWPSQQELLGARHIGPETFRTPSSSSSSTSKFASGAATIEGFKNIDFATLTRPYLTSLGGHLQALIPHDVMTLHNTRVGISGFAFPLVQEGARTRSFLLFGSRESMTEGLEPDLDRWIFVTLEEPQSIPLDRALDCYGVLRVEPCVIQGQLQALYRMESAVFHPQNELLQREGDSSADE
jgi:hypothetical protein